MARSDSTTLSLPPFSGATRKLILWNLVPFFAILLLGWIAPHVLALLLAHLELQPARVVHGEVWQLVTYAFLNTGLLSTFFALFSLWYAGFFLEQNSGPRWVFECFFASAIGGAAIATPIALTGVFNLSPLSIGFGPWAGIFGLLVAIAVLFGDTEFTFMFLLRMKARYMVVIYVLIYTAMLISDHQGFQALLQLAGGVAGFVYCRFAPRRGFGWSVSEQVFGMRNAWYRSKRRRAAKKFEVYMRKQNRDVHFDRNGRYVAPEDRDPNDRRWMN